MKIANDLVIYEVVIKQNLRAFLDISGVLVHRTVAPAVNLLVPIYTPGVRSRSILMGFCLGEENQAHECKVSWLRTQHSVPARASSIQSRAH